MTDARPPELIHLSKIKILFDRSLEGDLLDVDILVTLLIQRPDGTSKFKSVRISESETSLSLHEFLEEAGNLAISKLSS